MNKVYIKLFYKIETLSEDTKENKATRVCRHLSCVSTWHC